MKIYRTPGGFIPESAHVHKTFVSLPHLVRFAENADGFRTDSNAFTFMVEIEKNRRGYHLSQMFFLDNGLVSQMQYQNRHLFTLEELDTCDPAELFQEQTP